MPVVADASVAIRGDMSGFHRDLKGAETATVGFSGRLRNLLSPRNIIGAAGVFGIGLGVTQAVRQIQDVISEYSELKQAQRTVDDVFGESASVIEDWADRAADAAGLSKREVSLSASTMGTMLQNMGVDAGDAADMVVTLQQRAADLATAFPGKSAADAMLAFSAALRGERDTVEKFGVTLTQAMIDARIETMNLDTSTPAAERYATAIATLGLIMDQTAGSAGRFEDALEDNDPAAMAEALGARFENANASLAANAEDLIRSFTTPFIDGAEAVNDFFDDIFNPEKQKKVQFLADELGITYNEVRALVEDGAYDTGQTWSDTLDGMVEDVIATKAEAESATWEMMQGIYSQAVAGSTQVKDEWQGMADFLPRAIRDKFADIRRAGLQQQIEYAKGMLDGQNDVKVAIEAALQIVEEEMTVQEEIAYLSGQMTTLEHARGIASAEGKRASVTAIDAALELIRQRMAELTGEAYTYGANIPRSIAAGMYAYAYEAGQAAGYVAARIQGPLQIRSEPPDRSSPLAGITKWGGNIVKTIADGIFGELGTGSAAASALAGALVPGALAPMTGAAMPALIPAAGNTYQVYVNNLPDHPTLAEIGGELKRLGELGKLPGSKS